MKKFLAPLGIFVLGQLVLLVVFLFMPAIGNAADNLSAETAAIASTFWGWTWVVTGTQFWVFLGLEGAVLFSAVVAFLKS